MAKKISFVIIIFLLAAVYRFWGIVQGDFPFTYDVGRDLLNLKEQVIGLNPSLLGPTSGQSGVFYGPWWYWLMAVPFFLLGGSPAGMVSVVALTGLAAMLFVYFWGKKWENESFALSTLGIMGLSTYFISTTSQFWNPNLLILVTTLILILLSHFRLLTRWGVFLFGILITLAIELQLFFGVVLFTTIIACLVIFHRQRFLSKIFFFLGGVFLIELPRFFFELKNDFLQTKALLASLQSAPSSPFQYHLDVRLKTFFGYLSSVWPTNQEVAVLILSLVIFLLFLFVLYREKKTTKKIFYLEVTILMVVYFLAAVFYPRDFWNYYLIGLPVLLLIPVALVFSRLPWWLVLLFLLTYLRPLGVPIAGDASVYRNQVEVIDYLYQESEKEPFNVTIYTPPLFTYTWDYLFDWYALKKYGRLPSEKTASKLFLVIEPDPGFEGRITMWLKVREGDGQTIKEKTFPSGIIVQSRFRSL